jgi:mono/diheme cytochrome c family protein
MKSSHMNQGTTNKYRPRLLCGGVVVLTVLGAAAGAAARGQSATSQSATSVWDGVYTEAQAKKGETVYFTHCAVCHGDDFAGREQAPALAGLGFMEKWNRATVRKLFEKVEQMPPTQPKALPTQDYVDVVAYLLSVNELPAGQSALPNDRAALGRIEIKNQK